MTLAKILDVPVAIADATSLSETAYSGDDPETVLLKLIQAADYDVEEAERGIVYIDEIDKVASRTTSQSITHVASGLGLQHALLKILEGKTITLPTKKHEDITIDTTNILFICGGAFVGLEQVIQSDQGQRAIGFSSESSPINEQINILKNVTPRHLIRYGLTPELMGRMPIIVTLDALSEDDLVQILYEPKNAVLKQYQALLALDRVNLQFTEKALRSVAKHALQQGVGARGLSSIIEAVLFDLMFDSPSKKSKAHTTCTITDEFVEFKIASTANRELISKLKTDTAL